MSQVGVEPVKMMSFSDYVLLHSKRDLADMILLSRSLQVHHKGTSPGEPHVSASLLKAERKPNSQKQGRPGVPWGALADLKTLEAVWEASVCWEGCHPLPVPTLFFLIAQSLGYW
ncbi:hypothetical protein H1C71_029808 [Ictidomys tridecemlineatus]|nr:hypothetical protein H1C71_029808 [Ictidomys tridecemlineatus]KAG3260102.1 hypothetical protein H1C71_029808 [Ictidomys tridecemlineatus]KAG3260103.1 hypothetical protein H1C71_029808 [Ictidomys tridecemlineatus]